MDLPPFILRTALPALLAAGLLPACDHAPHHAPISYKLSDASVEALAEAPQVQDQIRGSLEMLFGTPANPAYARTAEWADDDFDPNHPWLAADDGGSGEMSEEQIEAFKADNRRRFARELELVRRGQAAQIRPFKSAPDLQRRLQSIVADRDLEADERTQTLTALFEDYYPSLRDSAELYRQQCLHCHGVEGGGDGPTSGPKHHPWLEPRPRDYRKGVFKFTAVKDKARPRREDLYHILDEGIYGTAMPSFRRFSQAEIWGLVDYVRLLSIRGETETLLVGTWLDDEVLPAETAVETFVDIWDRWQEAPGKVVWFDGEIPAPTPAMLARGRELYNDATKGNCQSCHGDQGLGDGPAAFKLDDNGKTVPAYEDDWGFPILPRNLAVGVYRGGGRPIDIYRRIFAGINGGPMPAIGESKDAEGNLLVPPEDMWSLVHYVRSLAERDESVVGRPGGM